MGSVPLSDRFLIQNLFRFKLGFPDMDCIRLAEMDLVDFGDSPEPYLPCQVLCRAASESKLRPTPKPVRGARGEDLDSPLRNKSGNGKSLIFLDEFPGKAMVFFVKFGG
jgi:hypothetical protein